MGLQCLLEGNIASFHIFLPILQETYNKAGDKAEETKKDAKAKYDDTQQTIADKLATDPLEEAKAHGQIPADTATVNSAKR